eukprot:1160922-Pelagomonas_calceolata.AAC.5
MQIYSVCETQFIHPLHASAVYADGGICLDILQNQWSPIYDVSAILTSIQVSLLKHTCAVELLDARYVPIVIVNHAVKHGVHAQKHLQQQCLLPAFQSSSMSHLD